jgi:hypothetical protein
MPLIAFQVGLAAVAFVVCHTLVVPISRRAGLVGSIAKERCTE